MKIKVILVEDDRNLQEIITYNLKKEGFLIRGILNGDDVFSAIKDDFPDIIILDWMLPSISGIELISLLKANKKTRDIPIIMLTARGEEPDKLRAFQIGADDYLTKPFSTAELIARTRAILKRVNKKIVSKTVSYFDIVLNRETKRVTRGSRDVKLGPIEFKLLEVFLTYPGRVFSREQLLDMAWGKEIYVEERTVDVHIGRLRRAINKGKEIDPLRTVRSSGYALNDKYVF